jgi:hypothetical protein
LIDLLRLDRRTQPRFGSRHPVGPEWPGGSEGEPNSDEVCEDAALVATELVANVVDHAGTPCTLTVGMDGDELLIEVRGFYPCPPPRPLPADPNGRRGRGLLVAAAVSSRWESPRSPTANRCGRCCPCSRPKRCCKPAEQGSCRTHPAHRSGAGASTGHCSSKPEHDPVIVSRAALGFRSNVTFRAGPHIAPLDTVA